MIILIALKCFTYRHKIYELLLLLIGGILLYLIWFKMFFFYIILLITVCCIVVWMSEYLLNTFNLISPLIFVEKETHSYYIFYAIKNFIHFKLFACLLLVCTLGFNVQKIKCIYFSINLFRTVCLLIKQSFKFNWSKDLANKQISNWWMSFFFALQFAMVYVCILLSIISLNLPKQKKTVIRSKINYSET